MSLDYGLGTMTTATYSYYYSCSYSYFHSHIVVVVVVVTSKSVFKTPNGKRWYYSKSKVLANSLRVTL